MTILAIKRRDNILDSDFKSSPFYDWWKEKSNSEKVKEDTNSFAKIELLFNFLQKKNCEIKNKAEIADFLNNRQGVADYLYEAPDIIIKKFGKVNLSLELCFDPEIKDDEGELFLNIETGIDVKIAHNKLSEIDKEWFLPRANKDIGKFNLNLEFI